MLWISKDMRASLIYMKSIDFAPNRLNSHAIEPHPRFYKLVYLSNFNNIMK